jgi:phosphopantetheine--protein transferase-like protein|uniref:Holo-[acyl-carrier-protein] synthase n=1 Tax=candidate division WOR-3 bacterium TaxID=2052148 RepID=A0A7V3RIQ4_UNCW3
MEIFGIGIDIIEVERIKSAIERHGTFIHRIFSPEEIKFSSRGVFRYEELAGRFAAKEAVLKAIKTGWRQGIGYRDIIILNEKSGAPYVLLSGRAKEISEQLRIKNIYVSISHTRELAIGMAISTI